jgi:hypothetical protein
MSQQIIQGAAVYSNGLRLDTSVSALTLGATADTVECTTFADTWKKRKVAAFDFAIQVNGYADFDDANNDERLFGDLADTDVPVFVGPKAGAAGEPAYFMRALETKYQCLGRYGDMAPFDFSAVAGDTPLVRGKILTNAARTGNGNGTGYDLGAPPSTPRLHAQLQCYALTASGGSPVLTVSVQCGSDNTFADAQTIAEFQPLAAAGAEHFILPLHGDSAPMWTSDWALMWTDDDLPMWGLISGKTWMRAVWTLSQITTCTFAVSVGYQSGE